MPAACRQPAEDCVPRGVFVEMEWLRIEYGCEGLYLLLVDSQAPGTKGLRHREVFEISPTHFAFSLTLMHRMRAARHSCDR
jgi:hypothetical protein